MRLKCFAAALLLASALPGHAGTVGPIWHNVFGNGGFPSISNTFDVGFTSANAPCGAFHAGGFASITVSVEGNGADPGALSTPTGYVQQWQTISANMRTAKFTRQTDGTETCGAGKNTVAWTDTNPNGLSYVLVYYEDSSGTPPATRVDSANGAPYFDNTFGNTMEAPSTSPATAGDLLESTYSLDSGNPALFPYAPAPGQTTVADTSVEGGTFFSLEILVANELLVSSGATGVRDGSYNGAFTRQNNGNMTLKQPSSGVTTATHLSLTGAGK